MARVFALAMLCSGCAVGLSAVSETQGTTALKFSTEGRGEVMAAGGDLKRRYFVSLGGGGGARFGGSGYGLCNVALGTDLFRDHRLSLGGGYTVRLGPEGPIHAFDALASWVFRLDSTGGERGFLALGPRVRVSLLALPDGTWAGSLSLGLELRWISFDTTGNSWGR